MHKYNVWLQKSSLFFLIILLWRLLDVTVSIIAQKILPYKGFFSYGKEMLQYDVPSFIRALTNFDGIFYIRIALNGYEATEQAFFPLYPVLIYNVDTFIKNPIISGVFISNLAFIAGIYFFYKYLQTFLPSKQVVWAVLFLLAYPTSYYFGVMYTEGLFFFLLAAGLYSLQKKEYFWAFLCAFLLALTKVIGVMFIVPVGIILLKKMIDTQPFKFRTFLQVLQKEWKLCVVLLGSFGGLVTYCTYLFFTTGDPLYFFHAQESFGANRSSHLITPFQVVYRYLNIFITADKSFQYLVAIGEFVFYIFAAAVLSYEFFKLTKYFLTKKTIQTERTGLLLFSIANVLVPSLTGTLTAVPRYSLMSLSLFIILSEIKSPKLKIALLIIFFVLHICYLALYIQGYYVT